MCVGSGWGSIRRDGSWAIEPTFEDIGRWSEGRVAVKHGWAWRYIETDGNRASAESFEDAEPFENGVAPAKRDGGWGLIDLNYRFVVEPQFEHLLRCRAGIFLALYEDAHSYIDSTGRTIWRSPEIATPPYPRYRE